MLYEGTVRVRLHPVKGITLDVGVAGSTLTATDAPAILTTMVEQSLERKVGIDRWSLYIPELAATMKADAKHITAAMVKPFLAEYAAGKREVTLTKGKWGKPRMLLALPLERTKKASAIIDLA